MNSCYLQRPGPGLVRVSRIRQGPASWPGTVRLESVARLPCSNRSWGLRAPQEHAPQSRGEVPSPPKVSPLSPGLCIQCWGATEEGALQTHTRTCGVVGATECGLRENRVCSSFVSISAGLTSELQQPLPSPKSPGPGDGRAAPRWVLQAQIPVGPRCTDRSPCSQRKASGPNRHLWARVKTAEGGGRWVMGMGGAGRGRKLEKGKKGFFIHSNIY